jgi:hypothetical protein
VIKSKNEVGWHVAGMGESRGAYRVLVAKLEGKRQLGRTRRRWEDNIKMDLQEMGWGHGLDRPGTR